MSFPPPPQLQNEIRCDTTTTTHHAKPEPQSQYHLIWYLQRRRNDAAAAVKQTFKDVDEFLVQVKAIRAEVDLERFYTLSLVQSFGEIVGPDAANAIARGVDEEARLRLQVCNHCHCCSCFDSSNNVEERASSQITSRSHHPTFLSSSHPRRNKRSHSQALAEDSSDPHSDSDSSRSSKRARSKAPSPDTTQSSPISQIQSLPSRLSAVIINGDVPIVEENKVEDESEVMAVDNPATSPGYQISPHRRIPRRSFRHPWSTSSDDDDNVILPPPSYIKNLVTESEPVTWHPPPSHPNSPQVRSHTPIYSHKQRRFR